MPGSMETALSQAFELQYYILLVMFLVSLGIALWVIGKFVEMIWNNFWEW